ncbi:ABC transporter ATP-binding protein [Pseudenhygromyxa sp. WMMC2535]|uniref:ABC transporter ATP-binding protein n=1 Tax=Pseudenhygromyxa sp. WMMC2535 TaxID=2712867 RepID=UPI0031F83698
MSNSLVIEDLSKTYSNGVQALRGVSLTIPTGMFGLLGPNGAGKSTLMRTIATLQDPDAGSIRLGELDVLRNKEGVRRVLGYLPQDFGVYPNVDALTLLTHFATLKGITGGERKQVVEALLHRVNLWEVRKNKLGGYSGGMRQRFGIAQALLGNPRLIIVDEPTAGLDPEERNRFLDLLSEIGEHVVVILSTHIVEDVADLCTNMAIIAKGQVLAQDAPQAAIARLRGKTWKTIIDREQLESYEREHEVISKRWSSGRTLIHVFADAQPTDSFQAVEPRLEDVYFHTIHTKSAGASEPQPQPQSQPGAA